VIAGIKRVVKKRELSDLISLMDHLEITGMAIPSQLLVDNALVPAYLYHAHAK
jgi:hypothetical protein